MICERQLHILDDIDKLGASQGMQQVKHLVEKASNSRFPILLEGETGVGKGVVARLLHNLSDAKYQPFIRVNCAAIPSDLLESELFGHVQGAFSSADKQRDGLLTTAGTGTLFLDELTELPLPMQSKLLHVLDERVFRPLGGDKERPFQARIIAASNKCFQQAVQEGSFREDLYFRLDVMKIHIPALRHRVSDIIPLANYLLEKIRVEINVQAPSLSAEQQLWLQAQTWKGNVRELKNTLERAILLGSAEALLFTDANHDTVAGMDNLACASKMFEHHYISQVIEQCAGDKSAAAKVLGISLSSLYRKMEHA